MSKLIDLLVKIASEEKDNATQDFLWGFVREQVEEEAQTLSIADKLKRTSEAGVLFLNQSMEKRE